MKPLEQKTTDTSFWDARRGRIFTSKGGWVIGEAIYNHGYSMMDDLLGKASFFQVLVLNVTGRLPEKKVADWLEALFICLSWPDARIWCNQIGSLAGSMRSSTVAAVSSGILASDSKLYGPGTLPAATKFITCALSKRKTGLSVEEVIAEQPKRKTDSVPIIVGYARPIASGDERITAMERVTLRLGFEIGEHLSLAYDVEKTLIEKYSEGMNLAGYCAAFLSDQGYTGEEIYRLCSGWVNAGVHACYAESADNAAESFFPLRCDDIEYQGKKPRPTP